MNSPEHIPSKTRSYIGLAFLCWALSMFLPAVNLHGSGFIAGFMCAIFSPLMAVTYLASPASHKNFAELILYNIATLANLYFLAICVFHLEHFYHLKRQRQIAAGFFVCLPLLIFLLSIFCFNLVHVGYFLWLFSLQAAGILELLHTSKFNRNWQS